MRLAVSNTINGLEIVEIERVTAGASRIAFTATSESTSFAITAPLANPQSTGTYLLLTYAVQVLSGSANNLTAETESWVEGGGGNDTLRSTDGLTILDGQTGNDLLDGTNGQTVLIGGEGNDVFITGGGDLGRDSIIEAAGQGRDEVRSAEGIILSNHANVEIARLTGRAAVNVDGTANADSIFGNTGRNLLNGVQGADTIDGGRGADTINGGLGKDLLMGGKDSVRDVFVFNSTADSGKGGKADILRQFSGPDVIDLRLIDPRSNEGDQAFAFSGTKANAFSVWYSVKKGDAIVSLDVTGDRTADMDIIIDNVTKLNAGDFLL